MISKTIDAFAAGDDIQSYFIIKSLHLKTSTNNKKYLDLEIADKTGEINAKCWDITDEMVDRFKTGDVVKLRGTVTLWQSTLQMKIGKMRHLCDDDTVTVEELVPSAPLLPADMMNELMTFIDSMTNADIKKLVTAMVEVYKEKLLIYPAAKRNHHAIRSGLLYHIIRMMRTGERICQVYPNLDRDLLYAGVILHDLEKINEMTADEFGIVSDYTKDGQLLGHLIMGIKKIDAMALELGVDSEISLILQHMVLSHHYQPEYGSPKKPMLPEAEILHYLDMMDARMYDMEKALKTVNGGEFTDGIPSIERRRIYKPVYSQQAGNARQDNSVDVGDDEL